MKEDTRSELQKLASRCLLETSDRGKPGKAFLFCYTAPGEGNTTVLSGLGEHLGRHTGARTLLVDGNLRSPGLHAFWRTPQAPGLLEACRAQRPLHDCIHETHHPNVHVLPAGTSDENLDAFYADASFLAKLSEMREAFQLVLFDSSPLSVYNDALPLGRALDGALLLARAEYLSASAIRNTHQFMTDQQIRLLGTVLNRRKRYVPLWIRRALHFQEES